MAKKKILTENGQEILPITHESCVLDNNGVSIGSKIGNINELATDSRTDLVSAINDILYFNNNIKQQLINILIANGIEIEEDEIWGSIIDKVDAEFDNMKQDLVDALLNKGVNVDSTNTYDELIGSIANIGSIKRIVTPDLVGGVTSYRSIFVITQDDVLFAAGSNRNAGILGTGDIVDKTTFTQVATNVKQVYCGYYATFIIKNDGSLWVCGYNGKNIGYLGLNDTQTANYPSFTQVTTNINNDVKEVFCGHEHTFLIKNDGTVWACGRNGYGQLGLGTIDKEICPAFVQVNIDNVQEIYCCDNNTFVLKNDGTVWACGDNRYGLLGLGTTDYNAHPTFVQII